MSGSRERLLQLAESRLCACVLTGWPAFACAGPLKATVRDDFKLPSARLLKSSIGTRNRGIPSLLQKPH